MLVLVIVCAVLMAREMQVCLIIGCVVDCTPYLPSFALNVTEVECNFSCDFNQYYNATSGCRNCTDGNTSVPNEVFFNDWPADYSRLKLAHNDQGTNWVADDFGITTGIQRPLSVTNFTISFDIINTTGTIGFFYKGLD
jgi:hypothetical protein